jgi:16S rRNA (uracil1498-N3)-methyltransferase
MAAYDFASTRLFVEDALGEGAEIALGDQPANYVRNVMRMKEGDGLLLFNGRDGEWGARLTEVAKKRVVLAAEKKIREQTPHPTLRYLFAPLKHARLDYMVQKAVEMGAGRLSPVITRRTQASRVNFDRMRANAVEAAEQCGILSIPQIDEPEQLARTIESWPAEAPLIFCDEDGGDPATVLSSLKGRPLGVLIGPEGGFDEAERAMLLRVPSVVRLSLGPRILRADTAAVAALAVAQSAAGDW